MPLRPRPVLMSFFCCFSFLLALKQENEWMSFLLYKCSPCAATLRVHAK